MKEMIKRYFEGMSINVDSGISVGGVLLGIFGLPFFIIGYIVTEINNIKL